MRKSIRLAAPALVAAGALLLAGCSSDDDSSDDADAGAEQTQEQDQGQEDDAEEPAGEDTEEGTAEGAEDPGDSDDASEPVGDGDSGEGGQVDPALQGIWCDPCEGPGDTLLLVYEDQVLYQESKEEDTDICTGTVSEGALSVTCARGGDGGWPGTEATMTQDPANEMYYELAWDTGDADRLRNVYEDVQELSDQHRQDFPDVNQWVTERANAGS